MRWSLTTSFLLHAAILAAAFVVLPNPDEFQVPPQKSIPVDIVSVEDFGKRQAMSKTAEPPKPEEKVAPKKSDPVKEVKPAPEVAPEVKTAVKQPSAPPEPPAEKPEPPEEKKVEAKPPEKPPEPKKEEPKPLDADPLKDLIKTTDAEAELQQKLADEQKAEEAKKKKAEEIKQAEAKKKADEKKKSDEKKKAEEKAKKDAKKKQKELNLDEVADLLNKIDDTHSAPEKPSEETGSPKQADVNLQGNDDSLAATLVDLLIKRFDDCWSPPFGARETQVNVRVRFALNQDGTVSGLPEVLNSSADPLFSATAMSAVSAVQGCGPYDFLPADKFELWKDVTVNFNPQMFGT